MRLEISSHEIELGHSVRAYAERRLFLALRRFGGHVGIVSVRLDASGRTGKGCRLVLTLVPSGQIVVSARGIDEKCAIDRAAEKTMRALERELSGSDASSDPQQDSDEDIWYIPRPPEKQRGLA
jgi:ribosome-associated translation inhibitor RaiA